MFLPECKMKEGLLLNSWTKLQIQKEIKKEKRKY